jgi:acetone carboxylase alpha subunit
VNKYWTGDATVGVRKGDAFMHNDARYGHAHNTDQSMMLPVFHDGELIAWAVSTVHEGENGAVEPGGMPSAAEQIWDEGLKMPPFKVAEDYRLKRDLVTFLQNSVREPKLQYEDMKAKLFVCKRLEERILEAIAEYGRDAVVATLRGTLEDTRAEALRRIREWPDAVVRHCTFADGTLRENAVVKIQLELRKQGDRLIFDYRGSSPEFTNRATNTVKYAVKALLSQLFLTFVWPDLPRNQAVFAPVEMLTDPKSALDPSFYAPNAQSMMTLFPAWTAGQTALEKLIFSAPVKYTKVLAPWYDMINTFLFGGVTQHGEMVGNVCADINGMSGGARADCDGENSVGPMFATMADLGEQEFVEEEMPFLQLVSKKLMRDNQGFGKFRGGMGYQMVLAMRGSPFFGFMVTAIGSKIPNVSGLFGGYGCPAYPLARIRNVDVFDELRRNPGSFRYSIEELMNERPFPNAIYETQHMGLQYGPAREGELYMIAQGTGGGYGDPLERDPERVMKDLLEDLVSEPVAREIYGVRWNPTTRVLDEAATHAAREAERAARRARGVPFAEFEKRWTTPEPPAHLLYFGSWDDPRILYGGSADRKMSADAIEPVLLPHPKDVRIAELEARVAELEQRTRD